MLKLMGLVHAGGGATGAECAQAWSTALAEPLTREAGVAGYVVSEVLERTLGELEADAFVELWWPDDAGLARALELPGIAEVLDADSAGERPGTFWTAREMVLKTPQYDARGLLADGSGQREGRVKAIGTAYRRADFSLPAFFDYWRDVHAPISARAPGLGAYVVTQTLGRRQGELAADAFVEQWWSDRATMDAAVSSPEVAAAWADVQEYAETSGTFWVCREHVLLAPAYEGPGLLER